MVVPCDGYAMFNWNHLEYSVVTGLVAVTT